MGIFDFFKKNITFKWQDKQIDNFKKNVNQMKNVFKEQKEMINDNKQQLQALKDSLSAHLKKEHISDKLNLPIYVRQFEETIELIKTSKNPDTVISRFEFLEDLYSKMLNIPNSIPNWNVIDAHIQELMTNKNIYVNESIKRNLEAELIKINQLKTEKGKINRLNRFFESIRSIPNLTNDNITYIAELEKLIIS